MTRIQIYDTTLRDGSQGEGVNFSLQDKLLITARSTIWASIIIEGGYPLSNPKDFEYFQEVPQTAAQACEGRRLRHDAPQGTAPPRTIPA